MHSQRDAALFFFPVGLQAQIRTQISHAAIFQSPGSNIDPNLCVRLYYVIWLSVLPLNFLWKWLPQTPYLSAEKSDNLGWHM